MRRTLLPARTRFSAPFLPPPAHRFLPAVHLTSGNRPNSSKAPVDFYTLFPSSIPLGPPPKGPFTIDPRALQREFFSLQQKSHPDTPLHVRTADGPSSAFINKAYTTLRDPLSRAQYLLSLRGVNVEDDEMLKIDDQELLMEVLEAQEEIEGAQREDDLKPLKQVNDERIVKSFGILEEAFAADDLNTAKVEAVRLKYWTNLAETLKNWEKGEPVVLIH
jgi:molecular chaperone HscB